MKIKKNFLASSQVQKNLQLFYDKPIVKVSLELVISVVVVTLLALFALRPTLLTMSELLKEIEEKEELDQALQQKIAALATAESEWQVFQSQVARIQQSFLQNPSLEEVLVYLEYLARKQEIFVFSMSVPDIAVQLNLSSDPSRPANSAAPNLALATYDVNFQVSGEYDKILDFAREIENQQPLMSIESIQINQDTRLPDENLLNASIRVRLYIQKPPDMNSTRSGGSTTTTTTTEDTLGIEE